MNIIARFFHRKFGVDKLLRLILLLNTKNQEFFEENKQLKHTIAAIVRVTGPIQVLDRDIRCVDVEKLSTERNCDSVIYEYKEKNNEEHKA